MEESKFVTVSVLNNYIARFFDANPYLDKVYLKGEISNFKWSGRHCYFSIKDELSEISAMMFFPDNQTLDFTPIDGMQIQVMGKVQVYPKRGTYAIIVKKMTRDGLGLLYLEFLELKEKLQKEGLFDEKYKKPLPEYPEVVAIITSPTGDAIHDIISTFNRRLPMAKLILYPALVQGRDAPADLVRALKQVYHDNLAEVLIIGRGGGSFEDLSCFNDETLARTLFASPIPTVTGIGHEADYTICDFVASYRAPTPTGAAMRLTKEKSDCYDELWMKIKRLKNGVINTLKDDYNRYQHLINSYGIAHYDKIIDAKISKLELFTSELNKYSPINQVILKNNRLKEICSLLQINFQKQLNFYDNKMDLINNILKPAIIDQKIIQSNQSLNILGHNLDLHYQKNLQKTDQLIKTIINKLVILNPFNTMNRGYAMVIQNNQIVSQINQLNFEKPIKIKMTDGSIEANLIKETYQKNIDQGE